MKTSTFRNIAILGALLAIPVAAPEASEILLEPTVESTYGAAQPDRDLRCFLAGRWYLGNLGIAAIEVKGRELSGVMRKFDDSISRSLYEMRFTATVGEDGRSAEGKQSYTFLTGFKATYTGKFSLGLSENTSSMTMTYTNGFATFKELLVKTASGECA